MVPYFHYGLEQVAPQNERNQLESPSPYLGKKLLIRVGDPINYSDITERYKKDIKYITNKDEYDKRTRMYYKELTKRVEDVILDYFFRN